MTCVRPNIYINKYLQFSTALPLIVSHSLAINISTIKLFIEVILKYMIYEANRIS